MDDLFCRVVSGRGFAGENHHSRHPFGLRVRLDTVVAGDHMQHIHQLAFIFVDPFNLHIKQRVRVHHHAQLTGDIIGQTLFIRQFGGADGLVNQRIILIFPHFAQLA
ncbi:Uncharacterised protein [Klebsiella pneumoniae]|nr:Uncharacterised protein [Klebsiella pneumoniae]SLY31128.1 Uncharacterised protein [Klebsiella pneumoniae]SXK70825.1 Uncharacterised protein [Klebsiella pneumoniae]